MEPVVLLPDVLCFSVLPAAPSHGLTLNVDDEMVYRGFFADFGPLDIAHVTTLCRRLRALVGRARKSGALVTFWARNHHHKIANAALLAAAYLVLCERRDAEAAFEPFMGVYPPLVPFRDACFGLCTFPLSVLDCLRGIQRAVAEGLYSVDGLDLEHYRHHEQLQHGDLNWVVPGKLLAFSGPFDMRRPLGEAREATWSPSEYARYFKAHGVTAVVRLNDVNYDRRRFLRAGVSHYDLEFEDGTTPPDDILAQFLRACDREAGALAVHCKAGLGRTGTLIACWLIKHHRFTGREAIAWVRLCRPGSIVGPQQHYICAKEQDMQQQAAPPSATTGASSLSRKLRSKVDAAPPSQSPPPGPARAPLRAPPGSRVRRGPRASITSSSSSADGPSEGGSDGAGVSGSATRSDPALGIISHPTPTTLSSSLDTDVRAAHRLRHASSHPHPLPSADAGRRIARRRPHAGPHPCDFGDLSIVGAAH